MDQQRPHGSADRAIVRQCTAMSKRSGQQCRKHAIRGRSVCRAHGGATPRGMASPHWKNGRYSTILPDRLASKYEDALQDRRLMSLRDAIALVDVDISESLRSLDNSECNLALEQQIWLQTRQAIECRRKLVETEVKLLVSSGQMMTAEQVLSLMAALMASVQEHVKDPESLSAVSRAMQEVIGRDQGNRGAWEMYCLSDTNDPNDYQ